MIAPHSSSSVISKNEREDNANLGNAGKSLYLVPGTRATLDVDDNKIQLLEKQVRQLNEELARMSSLLFHKEQLLQNFHVRERELKASLFHPSI